MKGHIVAWTVLLVVSLTILGTATLFAHPGEQVERYDANRDGVIDRNEAIQAVQDFLAGTLSLEDALAVIERYQAGQAQVGQSPTPTAAQLQPPTITHTEISQETLLVHLSGPSEAFTSYEVRYRKQGGEWFTYTVPIEWGGVRFGGDGGRYFDEGAWYDVEVRAVQQNRVSAWVERSLLVLDPLATPTPASVVANSPESATTPTPTRTPVPTPTARPTSTPTATPTPVLTATPAPAATATPTQVPTPTASSTPTATPLPTVAPPAYDLLDCSFRLHAAVGIGNGSLIFSTEWWTKKVVSETSSAIDVEFVNPASIPGDPWEYGFYLVEPNKGSQSRLRFTVNDQGWWTFYYNGRMTKIEALPDDVPFNTAEGEINQMTFFPKTATYEPARMLVNGVEVSGVSGRLSNYGYDRFDQARRYYLVSNRRNLPFQNLCHLPAWMVE